MRSLSQIEQEVGSELFLRWRHDAEAQYERNPQYHGIHRDTYVYQGIQFRYNHHRVVLSQRPFPLQINGPLGDGTYCNLDEEERVRRGAGGYC